MYKLFEDKAATLQEIKRILIQRPLVLPAVFTFVTCIACYFAESFYPAVITAVIVLVFGITVCNNRRRLILCYFITAVVIVFAGCRISFRSASRNDITGQGVYMARVSASEYRADGTSVLDCCLDSGAHVAVYSGISDEISTGDVLRLFGNLSEPDRPGNPGEFDYADYLHRKGIRYVMWPVSVSVICKGNAIDALKGAADHQMYLLRLGFIDAFSSGDKYIRVLALAVFTGDTSLLDDDTVRAFRLSNCAHLLAVSGTHFAGFLLILPMLLKAIHIKRIPAVIAYAAASFAVGMFTGWSDSVTRACVMSTCSFASRDGPSAMSLAVLIMLTANPFAALGMGFQLSFAAAGALLLFLPALKERLKRAGMNDGFAGLIAPVLTVMAAMLPFSGITALRLQSVILAIQIAASLMLQTACMFLIPGFALGINTPAVFCLRLLGKITAAGAATVSTAGIRVTEPGGVILACCALMALFLLPACFAKRHLIVPLCVVLSVCIGIRAAEMLVRPKAQVIFADVGQGDCCLIITDDKTCLIDAGVYEEGAVAVRDLLDHYGIASVDYAFMSHWDADHAGGIAALYMQGRIKTVYTGYTGKDKDVVDFLSVIPFSEVMAEDFLASCKKVSAGQYFKLSKGVELKVIAPEKASGGGNDDSLVMTLESGGKTVLFTGDIDAGTEEELIRAGVLCDCDVLKVAHHGSKYSTSEGFLEAVSPEIAVISVGKNNFYGHPALECLERLENSGCEIKRTDTDGAVIISLG